MSTAKNIYIYILKWFALLIALMMRSSKGRIAGKTSFILGSPEISVSLIYINVAEIAGEIESDLVGFFHNSTNPLRNLAS